MGAGLCMGLGAVGAGLGIGYTGSRANEALSLKPELSGTIVKTMLIGQAVAETAAIFSLVIAILLIYLDIPTTNILGAASLGGAGLCMGLGAIGSGLGSGYWDREQPYARAGSFAGQVQRCTARLRHGERAGGASRGADT